MLAVLLTLVFFFAWSAVGLAALVAVRADVRELRVALTAPVLGSALTVLPLFVFSNSGVPMETVARPFGVALLLGALVVLAVRRPRLSAAVVPVVVLCIVDLALVGRPMFAFGFDWIANANADMSVYVLAATHLLENGLVSPVDVAALADNRDFSNSIQSLHLIGLRPGGEIALAGLAAFTGRSPIALYMPMLLALNMCGIAAVGSLAMQASRRWWAASVAAALLVASPLAAYGVLQQLMPQVWGLGLAAALLAWLMRPEVHRTPGPRVSDLFAISVLTAALFVVYVELAASLSVAYGLYVVLLAVQRRVSPRVVVLLWFVPLAATAILVNTFLPRELGYLGSAADSGVGGLEGVTLFGWALVPTALPGFAGLQQLGAGPSAQYMSAAIVVAAILLAAVLLACLTTARRGAAASIVVLSDLALGAVLAFSGSDFGLFKLYMYMQPFVAAAVAVWLSGPRKRSTLVAASALLVLVVGVQLSTLNAYVDHSRSPVDLPHASDSDLFPAFRRTLEESRDPVVAATADITLGFLEAASADDRRLYFVGRNFFVDRRFFADLDVRLGPEVARSPWKKRTFDVDSRGAAVFDQNEDTAAVLSSGRCVLAFPTGSQVVLNRRTFPYGSPDLIGLECAKTRNLLIFTVSSLGDSYTVPGNRGAVSFWQLERDYFYPGETMAGFGRYALLELFNPTPNARLVVDVSNTVRQDGANRVPPAAVVGTSRIRLPVAGRGSARVFSAPLRPRVIGGRPYVLLDMGVEGRFPPVIRSGLSGLWGESVTLDPRLLTSYLRDVSLITSDQYAKLQAPSSLSKFPEHLADKNLEYSGIYEDGWVAERSYAVLSSGGSRELVVRANVLPQPGQRLDVFANGRRIASEAVANGALELRIPVRPSTGRQRIELRWRSARPLSHADRRPAAAQLTFLGFSPASTP